MTNSLSVVWPKTHNTVTDLLVSAHQYFVGIRGPIIPPEVIYFIKNLLTSQTIALQMHLTNFYGDKIWSTHTHEHTYKLLLSH